MKTHTLDFKEEIKLLGRQQSVKITYTLNGEQIILTSEDINSVTPNYNANILKSVMKVLDIDSNIAIPKNTEIKFEYGILIGNEYEYLNYGNYIVAEEPQKQEDTLSYKIKCYDKMLFSMKDYEELQVEYPCTIKEYLTALCTKIGLTLKNADFANQNREIASDLFADLGYKYRDVLDQIAETTGGIICLNLNDEVEVRYANNTNDLIDEEYINDTNVEFGEKYGPINSIVLSRAEESDNVYKKDDESIALNGLCEIKIKENQFMNFDNRSDYLNELAEKLFGLEYYLNDFSSTGIMYYDLFDKYNILIKGNTYSCIMLNDEQLITQGLEENIYTEKLEQSETDYSKADKTDQKINRTTLIVDKQNQKITQVIAESAENTERVNEMQSTVDGSVQRITETETRLNNDYLTADQVEAENQTLKDDIDIIKQQQTTVTTTAQGLQVQIDQINNEGVKTVKNTTVDINEAGVTVGKSDSEFSTTMNNTGTYMYAYGMQIAKYDKDGMETGNLKATGEVEIGYLKIIKATVDSENRTHIHWIGG